MATLIVDPGGTGDYTTLSAAVTGAIAGDTIQCISSDGSEDTSSVTVNKSLTIVAGEDNEALKTGFDTSRYRLSFTGFNEITITADGVVIRGLQITAAQSNNQVAAAIQTPNGAHTVIDSCRIQNTGAGTNLAGIQSNFSSGSTRTCTISNCIITDFDTTTSAGIEGFSTNTFNIYNCDIRNCTNGILVTGGADPTIKNCAIFACTDDINGTATVDYCGTDDGDGTNAVAPSGSDWDNEFADPANGDFTLLNTGNLYDAGIGPSSDANVPTTDIDGTTRSGATCDIGADEYAAAAVSGNPWYYYAQL